MCGIGISVAVFMYANLVTQREFQIVSTARERLIQDIRDDLKDMKTEMREIRTLIQTEMLRVRALKGPESKP